jgi:hypothetical protein
MPNARAKGQFGAHKRHGAQENGTRRADRGREGSGTEKQREPKDDPAFITAGALNVTKNGSIAAGVLAVLSAIPVFLKALDVGKLPDSAIYGAFALTGLCVVAVTVLIRTDMQTRASAKVSALQNSRPSSDAGERRGVLEEGEEAYDDGVVYDAPGAAVPIAEPFTVKLHDEDGRLSVLAAGWNPKTGTPAYLCARPGEKPRWIDDDEVQAVDDYEAGASPSLDAARHRPGH